MAPPSHAGVAELGSVHIPSLCNQNSNSRSRCRVCKFRISFRVGVHSHSLRSPISREPALTYPTLAFHSCHLDLRWWHRVRSRTLFLGVIATYVKYISAQNSHWRIICGAPMLTHAQVWSAIDRLAARAGLSASGLARRAASIRPLSTNQSASRRRAAPAGPRPSRSPRHSAPPARQCDIFVELINAGNSLSRTGGAASRLRRGRRRRLFR